MRLRRQLVRLAWSTIAAGVLVSLPALRADAQGQRGQPSATFALRDFAKLRWLEGTWAGTSSELATVFERYHFANDSTIEIAYYSDSALTRQTGSGRVNLTMGRIYLAFGSGRWVAARLDRSGVFFIPQSNAHNSFTWISAGPDAWTSTLRSSASGREVVTVYSMRRIGAP